jgi:hypothetical protein
VADSVDDLVCPASLAVLKAAPDDSAVWSRADFPVPTADDSVVESPDEAADIPWDGIPSCRGTRADSPKQSVEDDTMVAAAYKDSTILPNIRGCNKRGALPNSNPIHPIPRDDRPAGLRFQFPLQN